MTTYTVRPIGRVENGITQLRNVTWEDVESRIVVDPSFAEGLTGIEDFSHVLVVCYLHLQRKMETGSMLVHPRGRLDIPPVGVFATRSPRRPNPIAITVVPLLKREENTLFVRGLDMVDGTPVLDIKPYLIRGDQIEDATVAEWLWRLWDDT